MMTTARAIGLVATLLLSPLAVGSTPTDARVDGSHSAAPGASLLGTSGEFLTATVALERRRTGGPRPEVLRNLLARGLKAGSARVLKQAIQACERGQVRCIELVSSAEDGSEAMANELGGNSTFPQLGLAQLRQVADLQAMGRDSREALFKRILTDGPDYSEYPGLTPGRAAELAIWNGHYGLIGTIESSHLGESEYVSMVLLPVARALQTDNPADALMYLVAQGVRTEIRRLPFRRTTDAELPPPPPQIAAGLAAAGELRRLAAVGALSALEEQLALYRQRHDELGETSLSERDLGHLERGIAQVVGDLGSREAEREALGGTTLWDRVHQMELELRQAGRLDPIDMLTADR